MAAGRTSGSLERYRAKRDFAKTQRAAGRRGHARDQRVRGAKARRAAAALRPPAAVRRHAEELGGAAGAVARPQGPAARRPHRGPSARVRRLRGADPQGPVRRRRDDRLGPRHLGPDGRSGGGLPQGHAEVPAVRREARRRLDAGAAQAQGRRARRQLAADQGARPVRAAGPRATICSRSGRRAC